jgi:hypothetical protein
MSRAETPYPPKPPLKRGDVLLASRLTAIEDELRRLGRREGTRGLVGPPQFAIRITANAASAQHEWEEVYWNGTGYSTSGATGDSHDYAREVNGLACPKSDAVLPAWREPSGVVMFRAVRYFGVSDASIAANSTGLVSVWARQSGSRVDSGLNVTAFNWNDTTAVASGKRVMLTPVEDQWAIDYEVC